MWIKECLPCALFGHRFSSLSIGEHTGNKGGKDKRSSSFVQLAAPPCGVAASPHAAVSLFLS